MAATVAVGDIMSVKVFCYVNNQVSVNVHWFICTAVAGTSATYDQVATTMDLLFGPNYRGVIANVAQYVTTHVQRTFPLPVTVASESSVNAGVGTNGPSVMPTQVCGMITIRTAFAGRAYRGRRYIPFPSTAADTGTGAPTVGYQTSLTTIGTGLSTPIPVGAGGNTCTLQGVLVHKKVPGTTTPIVSAVAVAKFGTQKRRGAYGQPNVLPT
jgi:hypothetical protein